jgi:hypothetical protein
MMMTKPTIQIDDEIREMTAAEYSNYQTLLEAEIQQQAQIAARAEAKEAAQAKLAALGLTVEDLQALGL